MAEAQNKQKLEEVQRSLDTSGLEKLGPENAICAEWRNVDLTKYGGTYRDSAITNITIVSKITIITKITVMNNTTAALP